MKKMKSAVLLSLFISVINFSCKKNSDQNAQTTVDYIFTPFNSFISRITYNDSTGTSVDANSYMDFPNGDRTFHISKKPFLAQFSIESSNMSTAEIYFKLTILVNGQVKAQTSGTEPALANFYTQSVSYTIK